MHLPLRPQPEWLCPQPSALFSSFTGFRGHITTITLPRGPGYTLGPLQSPPLSTLFLRKQTGPGGQRPARALGSSRSSLLPPCWALAVRKQKPGQAGGGQDRRPCAHGAREALTLRLESAGLQHGKPQAKKPRSEQQQPLPTARSVPLLTAFPVI